MRILMMRSADTYAAAERTNAFDRRFIKPRRVRHGRRRALRVDSPRIPLRVNQTQEILMVQSPAPVASIKTLSIHGLLRREPDERSDTFFCRHYTARFS